jgi:hypothetical protein
MRMERFPSNFFSVVRQIQASFPDIISTSKPPPRTRAKGNLLARQCQTTGRLGPSTAAPTCANGQPHMQVARALSPEPSHRPAAPGSCISVRVFKLVMHMLIHLPTEQSTSPTTLPLARSCMSDSKLRGAARRAGKALALYLMTAISYA